MGVVVGAVLAAAVLVALVVAAVLYQRRVEHRHLVAKRKSCNTLDWEQTNAEATP